MFRRVSPRLVKVTLDPPHGIEAAPIILQIATGAAFPPTHPTSRLCLELLQEVMSGRIIDTMVDVGCGAGVLSLAAAALGVKLVVALDLARDAVRETRQNARDNALASPVRLAQGSSECVKGAFDLVVANLPFEVQVDKAREFHRLAAPAGSLILSGFRDYQESQLQEAYRQLGWTVTRRAVKDFRHPELPKNLSFTWAAWTLTRDNLQ